MFYTGERGTQLSHRPHHPCLSLNMALQVLAALLHGVQTIHTYDDREPTTQDSLDLTATQVEQAAVVFQQALLPHHMVWPPACLPCRASSRQGEALVSRLSTIMHELVYGCAVDASPTPEWLVITDGQRPGRWRLLHSTGPGQRCSVGSFQRHQPTPKTAEQRRTQDCTFEALHRVLLL